jgi:hypothetical protein
MFITLVRRKREVRFGFLLSFLSPLRGWVGYPGEIPAACAVGCILSPLRDWAGVCKSAGSESMVTVAGLARANGLKPETYFVG